MTTVTTHAGPGGCPRVELLGPVRVVDAVGVAPERGQHRRLVELAAFLLLHPGVEHAGIDEAMSPGRVVGDNARNTMVSRLRRWFGVAPDGGHFLPRHTTAAGYAFSPVVRTDWDDVADLVVGGVQRCTTGELWAVLGMVRGRPFQAVPVRSFAWAEVVAQEMTETIAEVAVELGRRHLFAGQWRAASRAAVAGLVVEPGLEALWRLRILAEHSGGDAVAAMVAVDRLHLVADQLGGELEAQTHRLLHALAGVPVPRRELVAAYAW